MPKHSAKHRGAPRAAPRMLRGAVVMGGLAVATTGMSVSGGVLNADSLPDGASDVIDAVSARSDAVLTSAELSDDAALADQLGERAEARVTRSDRRESGGVQAAKAAALDTHQGQAMSANEVVSEGDPREIGRALIAEYGFGPEQFTCLDSLYVSESNWRVNADNPTSSAYGIPQALTQLHDLPADYMTSAEAQIRWGLDYIERSYGTPCNAWSFKQGHGWY
ncbi:lytic transglycosylase domain-containing protein [Nocardioides bigeumensis]|uniref:Lytic transglycosylase domain-containing protein n=1 Tax=Nocardioides bigeumensis TaxID=433657 RepID=A0ABP5KE80_9ACTN